MQWCRWLSSDSRAHIQEGAMPDSVSSSCVPACDPRASVTYSGAPEPGCRPVLPLQALEVHLPLRVSSYGAYVSSDQPEETALAPCFRSHQCLCIFNLTMQRLSAGSPTLLASAWVLDYLGASQSSVRALTPLCSACSRSLEREAGTAPPSAGRQRQSLAGWLSLGTRSFATQARHVILELLC